ncbi:hypothetical protein GLOTRDRAFT_129091 [Gloeophyllum trabeum ATCC 11539]|uniref:F-box domain-containing protein n=1 Tax=Gloeophyllum trabeum (strain ATCC 11539 / FP-39264 / Madison 617) TaxID=670483 RepID=S7RN38_GLOTA|nr:uncharacterized protein GLOTRDRAFT_129091 [Gloeophyllum trabeum ATCC 11539]EPQ55880.1 hypothetical protein GLOTRDRAFT_129091 [Gloeophyllum trabeum ATCC 11539]
MALAMLSEATIVENLTLRTADLTPIGPPSNLVPLSLVSRTYYKTLKDDCLPDVFRRIFERRFDMSALLRRLGPLAPSDVAAELSRRYTSLKMIRRGSLGDPNLRDALMRAYFMLLEDDGDNAMQIAWSNLSETVENILRCSLQKDSTIDQDVMALAIVLCSALSQTLLTDGHGSDDIRELLVPFAFSSRHCPLSELPERDFYPLRRCAPEELSKLFPSSHYISYFGCTLRYNTPPVAAYAIQAYLAYYEDRPLGVPDKHDMPQTSANVRHPPGVTLADIEEYNSRTTRLRRRSTNPPSLQYDALWRRVTSRIDVDRPVSSRHELGMLSGSWRGTCLDGLKITNAEGADIAHYRTFKDGPGGGTQRPSRDPVDIIVTGEVVPPSTDPQHSSALGPFKFYGRVRPSDRLVVLVREPADPTMDHLGRDVFRGYLLSSRHMVGRRRHAFPDATESYETLWNLRRSEE